MAAVVFSFWCSGEGNRERSLRNAWLRERIAEVRGEVDEIADGDGVVVIQIAFTPRCGGFSEVAGEGDEVVDAHLAIAIQVAGEDEEIVHNIRGHRVAGQ